MLNKDGSELYWKVRKQMKQWNYQKVLVNKAEGGLKSLELLRNEEAVHILLDILGFHGMGQDIEEEQAAGRFILLLVHFHKWIAMAATT